MSIFKIAVIEGDGIGKEVVPEGIRVLEAAGKRFGFQFAWHPFDWSCERYVATGKMMPDDGLQQLRPFDAIFLGAVGHPSVPDHISLWGLLIPIRRTFQQYVNLRPVRLFEGIETPLKNWKPGDIDFVIVRENCEGEYSNVGGRLYEGTPDELALQQTIFTRRGVTRVVRYAFELARKSKKASDVGHKIQRHHLHHAVLGSMLPRNRRRLSRRPHRPISHRHFDCPFRTASRLVRRSGRLEPVRRHSCRTLVQPLLGRSASPPRANLNPEKEFPSMFEPVHGSAPDIAGKGIANPIGQIWSGAMMLRHLGAPEAADAVERAITQVLAKAQVRTPDIGGNSSTKDLGEAIAAAVSDAK